MANGKKRSLINRNGDYLSVVLIFRGTKLSERIHRLVYESFIGNIPKGNKWHIHHIDGNKQNNNISNLMLLSSIQHYDIDKYKHSVKEINHYNKYKT